MLSKISDIETNLIAVAQVVCSITSIMTENDNQRFLEEDASIGNIMRTPLNIIEWSEIQKKEFYTAGERDKILLASIPTSENRKKKLM